MLTKPPTADDFWLRLQPILKAKHFVVWLYYVLSLLLSVVYLQVPVFSSAHESQLFLYAAGIAYEELYQPNAIPKSLPELVRAIHENAPPPEALNLQDTQPFAPAQNVTKYSFMSLLPQIAAAATGYILNLSPLTIVYLARTYCMLLAVIAGSITLYLLPCFRWQMFYLLLLPSGFMLRTSQYADPMLNTASFLFFTLLVRLLYNRQHVQWRHFGAFGLLSVCVALSKVVYFPMCFTTLLLTQENFSSRRQRILFQAFVISVGVAATLLWLPKASAAHYHVSTASLLSSFYDPAQANDINASIRPAAQQPGANIAYLHFLAVLHHPFIIAQKLLHTLTAPNFIPIASFNFFFWNIDMLQRVMQHVDSFIPWFSSLLLLPFLFNQRAAPEFKLEEFPLLRWQRWVLALALLATYGLIAVALYIDYTPLYFPVIKGIQGRYLVPVLPFFCLLVSRAKFEHSDINELQGAAVIASLAFVHYYAITLMWKWLPF